MGSLVPYTPTTALVPKRAAAPLPARQQLNLVLDDQRLSGMTPMERLTVVKSLALLLLEAGNAAAREADHDDA